MQGIGIGIDIIELERVKKARFLNRLAEFVLSDNEMSEFEKSSDKIQFFASRFAVKEAVIKALPVKVTYKDFEVVKNGEKPIINFFDSFFAKFQVFISISHSTKYVAGFAVSI